MLCHRDRANKKESHTDAEHESPGQWSDMAHGAPADCTARVCRITVFTHSLTFCATFSPPHSYTRKAQAIMWCCRANDQDISNRTPLPLVPAELTSNLERASSYANGNPAHRPMFCHLHLASVQLLPKSLRFRRTERPTGKARKQSACSPR